MNKNMGIADRVIRVVAALTFIVLDVIGVVNGWAAIIILIFAGLFLLTGLTGYCPLYALLKINTCSRANSQA